MSTATSGSTSSATTLRPPSEYPSSSPPLVPTELNDDITGGGRNKYMNQGNLNMSHEVDFQYGEHRQYNKRSATEGPRLSPVASRYSKNSSPPHRSRTISSNSSYNSSSSSVLGSHPMQPPSPSSRLHRKRASTMYDEQASLPQLPEQQSRFGNFKAFSSPMTRSSSSMGGAYGSDELPIDTSRSTESSRNNTHVTSPSQRNRLRINNEAAEFRLLSNNANKLKSSQTFNDISSMRHTPNGSSSNRRSGVWDELESVKERLQRLKLGAPSEMASTSAFDISRSASVAATSRPLPYRRTSFSSMDQDGDYINSQKSNSPIQKSPVLRSTNSPLSHYNNLNNSTYQRSASPSQAEQHLRDVLERAKRQRGDINVMLLDRTAQDLLAMYNTNCDSQQLEGLDRTCVSLASFILQAVDSTTNSSNTNTNSNQVGRPETPPMAIPPFSPNANQTSSGNITRFKARPYLGPIHSSGGGVGPSLPRAASAVPFLGHNDDNEYSAYDNDKQHQFGGLSRTSSLRSTITPSANNGDDYSTPPSKLSRDLFSSGNRSISGSGGAASHPVIRRYGNSRRTHSTLFDTSGLTGSGLSSTNEAVRRKRHSLTFI